MNERILMIDDEKPNTWGAHKIARTYKDGLEALQLEHWDVLLLDFDMGDGQGRNGMGILKWLKENPKWLPKKIQIISFNPIGMKDMAEFVKELYPCKGRTEMPDGGAICDHPVDCGHWNIMTGCEFGYAK